MGIIATQLDKVRLAKSLGTDSELAALLDVTRQTVSLWRKGDAYPDEEKIAHMATLAGADAGMWLVQVRAERSSGEAHTAWASLARRFGAAAAIALCAVVPSLTDAKTVTYEGSVPGNVYYVKPVIKARSDQRPIQ